MPNLMRAAIVRALGEPVAFEDRPIPLPGAGQLLVRVVANEIPATMTGMRCDHGRPAGSSSAPAHVAVGRVVSGGEQVGLREGDQVGLRCRDGCFADYVVADECDVIALPRRLDPVAASVVLCVGARTYGALRSLGTHPGQWVAIWGADAGGRVALQYARAMGMRVIAIDRDDAELELAHRMGAHLCVNSAREDVAAVVHRAVGGAHGVLLTRASAADLARAMSVVRSGGACAIAAPPVPGMPPDFSGIVRGGVTVRGPVAGADEHLRDALQLAVIAAIGVELDRYPLADIDQLLARMSRGEIRGPLVLDMLAEPDTTSSRIAA